jgi:putative FmdB family regulatory protein
MPIYEYICQNCKNEFEILRPMAQADEKLPCGKCGGDTRRKISVFFAESGGKAVSGMSEPACGSCASGNCANCGN